MRGLTSSPARCLEQEEKEPESVVFRLVIRSAFMRPFPEFRSLGFGLDRLCPGGLAAAAAAAAAVVRPEDRGAGGGDLGNLRVKTF